MIKPDKGAMNGLVMPALIEKSGEIALGRVVRSIVG